jgi:hypothetical protein
MSIKWKILKWCLPVISYVICIGLFYFWDVIDRLIWGIRYNGGPYLSSVYFMVFMALPLIPLLYIILSVAQWIHKKSQEWFKIFAWSIMAITLILLVTVYPPFSHPIYLSYALLIIFPKPLWYYGPFFIMLSYILRKKTRQQNKINNH